MTMPNKTALAHVQNAERGNLSSLGALLRALVTGALAIGNGALTLAGSLTVAGRAIFTGNTLGTEAGAGVTGGTGTIYETSVVKLGGITKTTILVDLTGLSSVATDNDIIGQGAVAAHLGQITAAINGTILGGVMTCLETPAGGEVDLNLWSANEATGVLSDLITGLTGEITPVDRAGDWAAGDVRAIGAVVPAANQYLYLAVGTSSTPTAGAYTAGKFLIELYGY